MKRRVIFAPIVVTVMFLIYFSGCLPPPVVPDYEEPYVVIDEPTPRSYPEYFGDIINFGWRSGTDFDPLYVRYLVMQKIDTTGAYNPGFDIVGDLTENTWRYEDRWSAWIPYNAPDNAGRSATIGDDEALAMGRHHIFAVQARGMGTSITESFEIRKNVREFIVIDVEGPILMVSELYLGFYRFVGRDMTPVQHELPPDLPLNIRWRGDASDYGGEIATYRYGWDVRDLGNPDDWEVPPNPYTTEAPTRKWYTGVHTLYIEAVDNLGKITLAQIMIEVIPFSMERNLLWVDDFYAREPQSPLYEQPSESNHDAFWIANCSRSEGFYAERDIYDVYWDHNGSPPDMQDIGKYKNIVWTYSSSQDAWRQVIEFTPESLFAPGTRQVNHLSIFLGIGGHLWTLGRSERGAGLAAVFRPYMLPLLPATIAEDIVLDPTDASGEQCMPYRDYCVTMLDKVWGQFKSGDDMPGGVIRTWDRDALHFAYRDDADPITMGYPDLPERLDLWEEVTKSGRYFDPQQRGFLYVEVYDPEYYMDFTYKTSQECFHPMYRTRSRSALSAIDHMTVAIWITKYDDIIPVVESGIGVAARSVHFGFPLWFFDREAVNAIVDIVFEEWGILATP